MNLTDSRRVSLQADFGSKIDFIAGRTDARGDLHDEVFRIGS
jgi:hypothetical protein